MENTQESRAAKSVREAMETGRPLVYIQSSEEQRVERVLAEVGARRDAGVDLEPHRRHAARRHARRSRERRIARKALDFIVAHPGGAIFHLKDLHEPLRESSEIRRRLRDVYASSLDRRKFVVISSPVRFVPEEVERSLLFLQLRPPDLVELTALPARRDRRQR